MPFIVPHIIKDDPTNPRLDDGEVQRSRLQLEAMIAWLWNHQKTQRVVEDLTHRLALARPIDSLRRAIRRQPSLKDLKRLGQALDDIILGHKEIIGRAFSDHVHDLLGMYVPNLAIELVGLFVVSVQAVASTRSIRMNYSVRSISPRPVRNLPATLPELQAFVRKETLAARGRAPRKRTANLDRDVDWYCRHMIDGQSINRLTKEYMNKEHPEHNDPDYQGRYNARPLVVRGIRNVAKRLGLPSTRRQV